jgi:hypothetical protein
LNLDRKPVKPQAQALLEWLQCPGPMPHLFSLRVCTASGPLAVSVTPSRSPLALAVHVLQLEEIVNSDIRVQVLLWPRPWQMRASGSRDKRKNIANLKPEVALPVPVTRQWQLQWQHSLSLACSVSRNPGFESGCDGSQKNETAILAAVKVLVAKLNVSSSSSTIQTSTSTVKFTFDFRISNIVWKLKFEA